MATTLYGTLDSSPVNLYSQPSDAYPTDREGTFVEIDTLPSGASVDNIFFFDSPNAGNFLQRVITGTIRAANCGIYQSNSASLNTARMNAAFNLAGITAIVFDFRRPSHYYHFPSH